MCVIMCLSLAHSFSLPLWQELVEDQLPNGIRRPRYLAYDIMQLCGRGDIARCDHGTRLQCIQREIMAPRDQAVSGECARLSSSTGCVSAGSAGHSGQAGGAIQCTSEAVLGCEGNSLGKLPLYRAATATIKWYRLMCCMMTGTGEVCAKDHS